MEDIQIGRTNRGFVLGLFTDLYGAECSIQKSSLATDDAIWLGINDPKPQIMKSQAEAHGLPLDPKEEVSGWMPYPIHKDVQMTTRMHLSRELVEQLLPILQRFVETGEIS